MRGCRPRSRRSGYPQEHSKCARRSHGPEAGHHDQRIERRRAVDIERQLSARCVARKRKFTADDRLRAVYNAKFRATTDAAPREYLLDALGSPVAVLASDGTAGRRYAYDPWGRVTATGTGPDDNPFRFAAGVADPGGYVNFQARDYDPTAGRFTQPDPLAQTADQLDQAAVSPYAYVRGRPLVLIDPLGLREHHDGRFGWLKTIAHGAGQVLKRVTNFVVGFAEGVINGFTGLVNLISDGECAVYRWEGIPEECEGLMHVPALNWCPFTDGENEAACKVGQVTEFIVEMVIVANSVIKILKNGVGAIRRVIGELGDVEAHTRGRLPGVEGSRPHGIDPPGRAAGTAEGAEGSRAVGLDDAAGSCLNSFTGDTPVILADGTEARIAEVKVGDTVLATDPETGRTQARPVTALIRHGGMHTMVDLTLADGSSITATDQHPFWSASSGRFTDAIDLHVGDRVLRADGGTLVVSRVRVHQEHLTAFNLQVDGIHTYYAGTTPVLVHNSCTGPGESPVWKDFDTYRGKTKTNGLSGRDGRFYQWDYTHNNIEVYNRRGAHLGVMDPETGKMISGPEPGRKIGI